MWGTREKWGGAHQKKISAAYLTSRFTQNFAQSTFVLSLDYNMDDEASQDPDCHGSCMLRSSGSYVLIYSYQIL